MSYMILTLISRLIKHFTMAKGYLVLIPKTGVIGKRHPVKTAECVFGRSSTCDVRLYFTNVAKKHCVITVLSDGQVRTCIKKFNLQ